MLIFYPYSINILSLFHLHPILISAWVTLFSASGGLPYHRYASSLPTRSTPIITTTATTTTSTAPRTSVPAQSQSQSLLPPPAQSAQTRQLSVHGLCLTMGVLPSRQ